jgi:hypothetical protein
MFFHETEYFLSILLPLVITEFITIAIVCSWKQGKTSLTVEPIIKMAKFNDVQFCISIGSQLKETFLSLEPTIEMVKFN